MTGTGKGLKLLETSYHELLKEIEEDESAKAAQEYVVTSEFDSPSAPVLIALMFDRRQPSEEIRRRRSHARPRRDFKRQETEQSMGIATGEKGGGETGDVGGQVSADQVYGSAGRGGRYRGSGPRGPRAECFSHWLERSARIVTSWVGLRNGTSVSSNGSIRSRIESAQGRRRSWVRAVT